MRRLVFSSSQVQKHKEKLKVMIKK